MLWQSKTKTIEKNPKNGVNRGYLKTQNCQFGRSEKSRITLQRHFASLRTIPCFRDRPKWNHSLYQANKWIFGLLVIVLCGCNAPMRSRLPTPMPTEYLPTAVALTLEAGKTLFPPLKVNPPTDTPQMIQALPTLTQTSTSQSLATLTPMPPLFTPTEPAVSPSAISYGQVTIPEAEIVFRTPGHLSKVASPIPVYAILKPGYLQRARVELIGEDQRVLARQIISLPYINRFGEAILSIKLDFEIPGTAESARLSISVEDEYGRMTALNSIPLILLSVGESDIIPALDLRQPIFIQQPAPKTLIQGDTVVVSGRAHPDGDEFIMIQLVGQDGKVVGKRVCSLSAPDASDYGMFVIDVPYTVTESTPVLMIVWQSDSGFSNITHLTSQEVLLSP